MANSVPFFSVSGMIERSLGYEGWFLGVVSGTYLILQFGKLVFSEARQSTVP